MTRKASDIAFGRQWHRPGHGRIADGALKRWGPRSVLETSRYGNTAPCTGPKQLLNHGKYVRNSDLRCEVISEVYLHRKGAAPGDRRDVFVAGTRCIPPYLVTAHARPDADQRSITRQAALYG
jgi:hypothetical protein